MKKVLMVVAGACIAIAGSTVEVKAICPNERAFGTFDNFAYVFTYVHANAAADNASIVGRFWQAGARSSGNEGTYDDTNWLRPYGAPGTFYLSGFLASDGVAGCIDGTMVVALQDSATGDVAVASVAETPPDALWYNFTHTGGDINLVAAPRPMLSNRQVAGSTVNFDITLNPITALSNSDGTRTPNQNISAYRLVRQTRPSSAPAPSHNMTDGWQFVESLATTTAPVVRPAFPVDCTDTSSQVYLGVQLSIDGGQFLGDTVGPIVQVSCDPNMAEPGGRKFQIIDRKSGIKEPRRR